MRAIVTVDGAKGPTLQLQTVPDPVPGPEDLLVAVRAAGVNRADLRRSQQHYAKQAIDIAGLEFAGEVIGVGSGVDGWACGDRIMAMGRNAYAEQAVIDHRLALRVPDGVSWEAAAALPTWFLTAYDALGPNGALQQGESVLIQGVTSGIGIAAVQVATLMGARVVMGAAADQAKLARLRSEVGLHHGFDREAQDLAGQVRDATEGRGADVIVDMVGAGMLARAIDAAALCGRIVSVGRLGGFCDTIDLDQLALKRLRLIGVTFRTRTLAEKAALNNAFTAEFGAALREGRLRPLLDRSFPLDAALEAQAHVRANAHLGKVLLTT